MEFWKELQLPEIIKIDKLVAEFNLQEIKKTPWLNFRVKIFEQQDGTFYGYTNLQLLKSPNDTKPVSGYGKGKSIEEALISTVRNFMKIIYEKKDLTDSDFRAIDPYDF